MMTTGMTLAIFTKIVPYILTIKLFGGVVDVGVHFVKSKISKVTK